MSKVAHSCAGTRHGVLQHAADVTLLLAWGVMAWGFVKMLTMALNLIYF